MTNRTNPWNIYAKRYKHNQAAKAILCFIALALMVFLSTYS